MEKSIAWQICDETNLEDHDPDCSYRQADGAILCDCEVLLKQELP
jgi:hypothetical protein